MNVIYTIFNILETINDSRRRYKQRYKELQDIQKQCKHQSQYIRMLEDRSYSWICNTCNHKVRIPTTAELDKWLKS